MSGLSWCRAHSSASTLLRGSQLAHQFAVNLSAGCGPLRHFQLHSSLACAAGSGSTAARCTLLHSCAHLQPSYLNQQLDTAVLRCRHEPYNFKVDVYSFSMIAYQLFEYCPPFAGMDPVEAARQAALHNKRPEFNKLNEKTPVMQVGCRFAWTDAGVGVWYTVAANSVERLSCSAVWWSASEGHNCPLWFISAVQVPSGGQQHSCLSLLCTADAGCLLCGSVSPCLSWAAVHLSKLIIFDGTADPHELANCCCQQAHLSWI